MDEEPDTTSGNPFSLIAFVLFKARHALEDLDAERPPRWVRIARGRQFADDTLGGFVRSAVGGLASATSYMAELTLDIEELLIQTDAAKAIAETSLELIAAATGPEFVAGINTLLGNDLDDSVSSVFAQINGAAQNIEGYLGFIPEPHDVKQLGHEIYRLQCIVQRPMPRDPATGDIDAVDPELVSEQHLELEQCGKIRLCAWAYGSSVRARGLGTGEQGSIDLFQLGSRRLFEGTLATTSRERWTADDVAFDLFEFDYTDSPANIDLTELVALLGEHGYADPAMAASPTQMGVEIVQNLLRFQHLNELPLTGELDNETLNRLHNLDFGRKNLRRAVPYEALAEWPWNSDELVGDPGAPAGELELINPGADEPERENIELVVRTPHPYYPVPAAPDGSWPEGRGWVADPSATPGFVALRSRARNPASEGGRYVGGIWSEGEAALGRYFWAARHTEPWRDGRTGVPGPDALFGGSAPAAGEVSRMYQWLELPSWLDPSNAANFPAGMTSPRLYIRASCLQRALFSDRNSGGFPDQGRLLLEAYPAGVGAFEDTQSARTPSAAVGSSATELFPSHSAAAALAEIEQVDRKRLWTLRMTDEVEIVAADSVAALCVVVEGHHQSAYDTDAYFDDVRVHYSWREDTGA
ncbi:MAG: hypothetical protein K0V04_31885 [Deltaproteobacteria bacterium]|nr:hypothetical protein [Deltaproteobacteria bacterium]